LSPHQDPWRLLLLRLWTPRALLRSRKKHRGNGAGHDRRHLVRKLSKEISFSTYGNSIVRQSAVGRISVLVAAGVECNLASSAWLDARREEGEADALLFPPLFFSLVLSRSCFLESEGCAVESAWRQFFPSSLEE